MYEGVLFEFDDDAYVSQDYVTAIHWYTKAAQQGHVGTAFQVGTAFLHSRRIRRRLGAGVGTAFQVGTAFLLKRCTKKWDYLRGLTKAAEQGHVIAQYKLGLMYYQGGEQGWDVSQSYVTAVHWMTKAAQRGYAKAQISLARMYGRGEGVVQDTGKWVKWYKKAAKQGHAEAQYELGDFHLNPFGHGEVDDVKAAKWFTKAAEQGHAEAQYKLGKIYRGDEALSARLTGAVYRVKVDDVKAVKWLTKAAEQGVYGAPAELRDTVKKLNTLTAEIIYNSTLRELRARRVNNIASVEALFGDLQK
jgi:TPR repeat protein